MRNWLKELRHTSGLTQDATAKRIGISQNYYSSIEKGERQADMSLSIITRLANAFKTSEAKIIKLEKDYQAGVEEES